jgi:hypothetical protein
VTHSAGRSTLSDCAPNYTPANHRLLAGLCEAEERASPKHHR